MEEMHVNSGKKIRIVFNAPAVLGFALICLIAQVLNMVTGGGSNAALFSVYRSSLLHPLTYLRLFCHVFGHGDWNHLLNNMMYLMILGPMLEEKYGTKNLVLVMAVTALVTGLLHMLLFPASVHLLGASGVVFALILLSSITATEENTIPVTFILVAVMYLGQQIYQGVTSSDHISQLTHIAGGVVGSCLGFAMNRARKQGEPGGHSK